MKTISNKISATYEATWVQPMFCTVEFGFNALSFLTTIRIMFQLLGSSSSGNSPNLSNRAAFNLIAGPYDAANFPHYGVTAGSHSAGSHPNVRHASGPTSRAYPHLAGHNAGPAFPDSSSTGSKDEITTTTVMPLMSRISLLTTLFFIHQQLPRPIPRLRLLPRCSLTKGLKMVWSGALGTRCFWVPPPPRVPRRE